MTGSPATIGPSELWEGCETSRCRRRVKTDPGQFSAVVDTRLGRQLSSSDERAQECGIYGWGQPVAGSSSSSPAMVAVSSGTPNCTPRAEQRRSRPEPPTGLHAGADQQQRSRNGPWWSQVVAAAQGVPANVVAVWSQSGDPAAPSDSATGPLSCDDGGAPRGIRTPNRQIRSLVLYPLS